MPSERTHSARRSATFLWCGFESFALAPLAETANVGVSVRLTATRAYRSGDRTITVAIDTEDIETAAMIDAVDAVSGAEDGGPEELVAYGEGLLAAGATALSHDGYPALRRVQTARQAARSRSARSAPSCWNARIPIAAPTEPILNARPASPSALAATPG